MVWFYYAVKRNIPFFQEKRVMKGKKAKIFFMTEYLRRAGEICVYVK